MTEQFATADIRRDRFGRPLVVPPGGGPRVAYRRTTTFVGALEDTYALQQWKQRQVAIGSTTTVPRRRANAIAQIQRSAMRSS